MIDQPHTWYLAICLQPPSKLSAKTDPLLDLIHVLNGEQKLGDHEAVTKVETWLGRRAITLDFSHSWGVQ